LVLGAGYAQNKYKTGSTDLAKVTGYSFVAKYALSKRTFAYGAATNTKTELTGTTEGSKKTLFAVGVQHAF
jgi:predicted porin